MKIQKVSLRHFKRFRQKTFDFTDPETGLARNLIVLAGMNGSGKSSVLQAIACMVGNAVNRLRSINDLNWPGFNTLHLMMICCVTAWQSLRCFIGDWKMKKLKKDRDKKTFIVNWKKLTGLYSPNTNFMVFNCATM